MPTPEQLQQAKERRERRRLDRDAAVEKAHSQIASMPEEMKKPKPAAKPRKPRRVEIAEQREAHTERAQAQLREIKVTEPDVDAYLGTRRTGQVPLNVLNALANRNRQLVRDDAREIANAAGKAAFSAALGRKPSQRDPHKKVRDAQSALAAQNAKLAAAKKAE